MKRKIISHDVFHNYEKQSVINTENELVEAQDVLSEALGLDFLELHTFGESDVTYETPNGNYIHATYTIDDEKVILENIEELIIDEASEKNNSREIVSRMVEAIVNEKEVEATQQFESYLNSSYVKRVFNEATWKVTASKPTGRSSKLRHKRRNRSAVAKGVRSRRKTLKAMSPGQKRALGIQKSRAKKKLGGTTNKRARVYARKVKNQLKEWNTLSENVLEFINYRKFGPVFNKTILESDDQGNIVSVTLPNLKKRNEGKILSFNWKTTDTTVKVLRGKMKDLNEDQNFAKATAELKRYNNISDNQALEETLENIVTKWPDVLYLTEAELADQIKKALTFAEVNNFDDETCQFMAEAILRTAHNAHVDRVSKIAKLSGTEQDVTAECKDCEDAYSNFKEVAENLFNKVDEEFSVELQVFSDLAEALTQVQNLVEDNEELNEEIEELIEQCNSIATQESKVDYEFAEEVADFLNSFVEANIEGASNDWSLDTPHNTVNGDNPVLSKKAKADGAASNYPGDWKSPAPVSDGKDYDGNLDDEMKNHALANSENDTWPSLNNPYILKADSFKMKEKSVVDDNENLGQDQSSDTWPNLENPYCPKAEEGNGSLTGPGGDN